MLATATPSQVNGKSARKPRAKPARSLSWKRCTQAGVILLTLTVGKESDTYHVRRIDADRGDAFEVTKINMDEPDVYAVLLDGLTTSCECKGFLRWSRCKHVDALRSILERGNTI